MFDGFEETIKLYAANDDYDVDDHNSSRFE
jgi:hypothetical protein